MKFLRYSLLATVFALSLSACSTASDPQPELTPSAHYEMNRVLYYPANATSAGVSYAPAEVKAAGQLATELRLSFGADRGEDDITFTLPATQLTPNVVGSYSLQSRTAPGAGSTHVAYTFTVNRSAGGTSGRLYLSTANRVEGQLVLTNYDGRRRLLSGTYTLRLPDIADPYSTVASEKCNLTLQGSFENLPLQ